MKKLLGLLIGINIAFAANAQSAKDSVMQSVKTFFKGMHDADAILLRTVLSGNAVFQTISNTGSNTVVKNEDISDFVNFVSQQTNGDADERIEFGPIHIDANLASVWTPYKFYYKGKFSHCGVNSFQLVRMSGQWKIQYIIDTRRKEGCN